MAFLMSFLSILNVEIQIIIFINIKKENMNTKLIILSFVLIAIVALTDGTRGGKKTTHQKRRTHRKIRTTPANIKKPTTARIAGGQNDIHATNFDGENL